MDTCTICEGTGQIMIGPSFITCICQTDPFNIKNIESVKVCANDCKKVEDCDKSCMEQK